MEKETSASEMLINSSISEVDCSRVKNVTTDGKGEYNTPESNDPTDKSTADEVNHNTSTASRKSFDGLLYNSLVPKLKNLLLAQEEVTPSVPGDLQIVHNVNNEDMSCLADADSRLLPLLLAGHVKAVIQPTEQAVVQLAAGSRILDVGTVMFARAEEENGRRREIGFILEIFGSVSEPMYALQMRKGLGGDSLRLDSEVFYCRDHASTRYVNVTRQADNSYSVMENQRG